ncbi:AraC family transcriptional regulator [Nocardioides sp. WS12]|uniref:AraC family transcriptional regulator n=1 Tax=Nocardioides sp. WS12 TaxID=2486272 RepID=UPI0015FE23DE|nr:AraC family transcriptional regulator [Nocardioides sp. WS12]
MPEESPLNDRTVPIELVQASVAHAARRGIDVNQMLADAGVSPMLLGADRSRVTESQLTRIVQTLWRVTDDELFGLGRHRLPRGTFRLLCFGLLSAPDLAGALDRLEGFARAIPAMPEFSVVQGPETTRIAMRVEPDLDLEGFLTGIGVGALHRFLAWSIGRTIALDRLELPHPFPPDLTRFAFGIEASKSEEAALSFKSTLLTTPIVRTDAEVESFVAGSPHGLLTRPHDTASVSEQVRRMFELALRSTEWPGSEQVAKKLVMSPQTLRRKLAEEGSGLREIREEVLRDAAVSSLVRGEESVAALSERLGFSEPSAFTRAFRRWTGSSPAAYRRSVG